MASPWVFAIDLGTTYSTAAVVNDNNDVEVLGGFGMESKALQSVIFFPAADRALLGRNALRKAKQAKEGCVIRDSKRYIGLDCPQMPPPPWNVFGRQVCPITAAAIILRGIKEMARKQWSRHPMDKVVITHPQYWGETQKWATRCAGEWAGLDVVETLSEPNAAAIAYGMETLGDAKLLLVFDLGGGTLDTTIFETHGDRLSMITSDGDSELGGRDWDDAVKKYLLEIWQQRVGYPFVDYTSFNLVEEMENKILDAKHQFQDFNFSSDSYRFTIAGGDCDPNNPSGTPSYCDIILTRQDFEQECSKLVDRCREVVRRTLRNKNLTEKDIGGVILAGGSSKLRSIRAMLDDLFGEEKCKSQIDPLNLIAIGAAHRARNHREDRQGSPSLAVKNMFQTIKDFMSPADVTAKASIAALSAEPVVARTVGVLAYDRTAQRNIVIPMINKDTPRANAKKEELFETTMDDQAAVVVDIFEGSDPDPSCCVNIGTVRIPVPPRPRGQKVRVNLEFRESGILHVSIHDLQSNSEQQQAIDRPLMAPNEDANLDPKVLKEFAKNVNVVVS